MRFYGKDDYSIECVRDKKIAFIHAAELNDPFDPNFYFITEFKEDYRIFSNWVRTQKKDDADEFFKRLPEKSWANALNNNKKQTKHYRENALMFSACEVEDDLGFHPKSNLYMWGHYGNGHRGVAIEFDAAILEEAVKKSGIDFRESTTSNNIWCKIDYVDIAPKILCEDIFEAISEATPISYDENNKLKIKIGHILNSKSKVWEKENEWRLMLLNNAPKENVQKLDLIDNSITAVYLGCRISEFAEDIVISETRRNFPKANIFKCRKKDGEFILEFNKI